MRVPTSIVLGLLITFSLFGETRTFQSTDPLLSNYRKNSQDGYSWRQREVKYSTSTREISVEKLLSTRWVGDPIRNQNIVMVFFKDGVFKYGSVQAGEIIVGTFQITSSGRLRLTRSKESFQEKYRGFDTNEIELIFSTNSDNMFYSDHLTNDNIDLFAVGSEQRDGFQSKYEQFDVERDSRKRVTTDNVFFRMNPSRTAPKYQYSVYDPEGALPPGLLFRGTELNVVAHTSSTDTIDGITASWLLVRFPTEDNLVYGWVFGGYSAIFDQKNSKSYEDQLKLEMAKVKK